MSDPTLAAGNPIEAHCTKCRKNTEHIVVTMEADQPAKVQCQSCNRRHKYRPPKATGTPAERQIRQRREAEGQEWKALQEKMSRADANDYSMTAAYKVGEFIDHPAFGIGCVQRMAGPRKVEVLFETGRKTMRCK